MENENLRRASPVQPGAPQLRAKGMRRLDVSCWDRRHSSVLDVDQYGDDVPVPSFGPRWSARTAARSVAMPGRIGRTRGAGWYRRLGHPRALDSPPRRHRFRPCPWVANDQTPIEAQCKKCLCRKALGVYLNWLRAWVSKFGRHRCPAIPTHPPQGRINNRAFPLSRMPRSPCRNRPSPAVG